MSAISELLLPWFESHGRKDLPWQIKADAYRVWVSEIMLQQTQVSSVIPYFVRFMQSFSTVKELAQASLDDVLMHWAGLGYYARARNLHKAAKVICDQHAGQLPCNPDELMALPGIGRSTAGAILSLAHAQSAAILDGNVKRVLARVYQVSGWSGQSATLKLLWALAEQQTPRNSVGQYNQAMMDLGAMICTRTKPLCDSCPVASMCLSYKQHTQAQYPQSRPAKKRPHKHLWMLIHMQGNRLLLERRPEQGIWGGLWSLPELETLDDLESWQYKNIGQPHKASLCEPGLLKHQFSHFDLSISVARIPLTKSHAELSGSKLNEAIKLQWFEKEKLKEIGLPAPVYKILRNDE